MLLLLVVLDLALICALGPRDDLVSLLIWIWLLFLHVDLQSSLLKSLQLLSPLWLFAKQNIMNTDMMTNDAEAENHHAQDEDTSSSKFIFCIRLQKSQLKVLFLCLKKVTWV